MAMVAERLEELFQGAGYQCAVTRHSVWENYSLPFQGDLLLQLLPAFTADEAGCPVINVRPFLVDLDHLPTIEKIMAQVRLDHQGALVG
jgi:hypothetical protein